MKYTVLIAEDEKDIIEVIKLYLESDIIKVLQAKNGEEAYEITKKNKVDWGHWKSGHKYKDWLFMRGFMIINLLCYN